MTTEAILSRINKVQKGCWLWTGAQFNHGYGKIFENKKYRLVHRIMYERFVGAILPSFQVLHSCDTPLCVNPSHLFLGTIQANMKDRDEKGRQWNRHAHRNGRAKLDWSRVDEIRRLYNSGLSLSDLSRQFKICHSQISEIAHGKSWIEDGKQTI